MLRKHTAILAASTLLAACANVADERVPFELGAAEFHHGDAIVIEDVLSPTGALEPGSIVTIRGRYTLASRDSGSLYFGTTTQGSAESQSEGLRSSTNVARGSGTFELQHRMPAPGHLHVTFYDVQSGLPFGGQYFGRDESLLTVKDWAYAR